ncbi:hypothetical protein AMTR_s00004p00234000 [Amborella trichopoda]|uniref:Uncharacterized protein n=1 Tax=Amborella trichopoda TaxID=13333 RepID=W1NEA4_AMBTC|nr:hypothetical protein AMTR_s00004p00234000 [Amborella trichopoda]
MAMVAMAVGLTRNGFEQEFPTMVILPWRKSPLIRDIDLTDHAEICGSGSVEVPNNGVSNGVVDHSASKDVADHGVPKGVVVYGASKGVVNRSSSNGVMRVIVIGGSTRDAHASDVGAVIGDVVNKIAVKEVAVESNEVDVRSSQENDGVKFNGGGVNGVYGSGGS